MPAKTCLTLEVLTPTDPSQRKFELGNSLPESGGPSTPPSFSTPSFPEDSNSSLKGVGGKGFSFVPNSSDPHPHLDWPGHRSPREASWMMQSEPRGCPGVLARSPGQRGASCPSGSSCVCQARVPIAQSSTRECSRGSSHGAAARGGIPFLAQRSGSDSAKY